VSAIGATSLLAAFAVKDRNPPGEAVCGPSRSSIALDPERTAQTGPKLEVRPSLAWCLNGFHRPFSQSGAMALLIDGYVVGTCCEAGRGQGGTINSRFWVSRTRQRSS
jgi:hypothetical protein